MVSPKETLTTVIMINKNPKAMFRFPDGDIKFFEIIDGV